MNPRPLNAGERAILDLLLEREFPGRDDLVYQARSAQTLGSSCTCGCPSFSLEADRSLPPASVVERMPTDAHGVDPGGKQVGVLLFVDDGYLSEVEVYGFDDAPFSGLPDASALKLSNWSEPDQSGSRRLLNP